MPYHVYKKGSPNWWPITAHEDDDEPLVFAARTMEDAARDAAKRYALPTGSTLLVRYIDDMYNNGGIGMFRIKREQLTVERV